MGTSTIVLVVILVIFGLSILVIWGMAKAMLFPASEEIVLCSPIEGIITYKGEPVAGAKVERFIAWKNKTGEKDTAYTDQNGKFILPVKSVYTSLTYLSQLVVAQDIHVHFNGTAYQIWLNSKMNRDLYGELYGIPVNFRCELTDELAYQHTDKYSVGTSCKWDAIQPKQ